MEIRAHLILAASFALLAGCDGTSPARDGGLRDSSIDGSAIDGGGSDGGGSDSGPYDGGPLACEAPDRACPAEQPREGAPCEYADACSYIIEPDVHEWTYTCVSGRWSGTVNCALGGACLAPFAESCTGPVRDHGARTVEIGPVEPGAFRPFVDGEDAAVIFGGQGSPMIEFRVRTAMDAPTCVEVISTLATPVAVDVVDRQRLRLRCGSSLGVFTVMPSAVDCPSSDPVDIQLSVELTGIGSASATLRVPGMVFCAPLPG